MSVYFEKKISTTFGDICTEISWFRDLKLAIACFSQEKGGYISVYKPSEGIVDSESLGKHLHNSRPVSAIAWHPQGSLFGAWDGGAFCFWSQETGEIFNIESPHQATITLLKFSSKGGRLISADIDGGLVGWNSGGKQLLTAFHHQLSDSVSHIVFRNPSAKGLVDLWGAARAAVAGDPRALDLFTNLDVFTSWRPKTGGGRENAFHSELSDNQSFYAASASGVLFYISENGRCQEVFDLGCACCDMLYRPERDQLIVLTELMAVVHFNISPEGVLEELMKVKLSGGNHEVPSGMVWTKPGIVAINSGSSSIRLWNLDTGDNSTLNLPTGSHHSEHFTSLSYCTIKGVLCGGTNAGNLIMWKKGEQEWEIENSIATSAPVKQVIWGNELLVVNTMANLYILKQQPLAAHHNQNVSAVQVTGNNIVLLVENSNQKMFDTNIQLEMQVHGVAVSNKYCVIWSDETVSSYLFTLDASETVSYQVTGTFACKCEDAAIYEESLIIMEHERVTLRTVQGTVKQTLFLVATEGNPIVLGLFSHFITVVTSQGFLKVWDISKREAKIRNRAKNLNELIDNFGEVIKANCNSNGTKVAFTVALDTMIPDSKLYILDFESDNVMWIDFSSGETHIRDESNFFQNVSDKIISSFEWDSDDPKLLVCHAKPVFLSNNSQKTLSKDSFAILLWVANEKGLLIHEMMMLTNRQTKLLACSAPHVVFLSSSKIHLIDKITMSDFGGVECKNDTTKQAILNFSYNLAVGNMDQAFKAINAVTSESVWTNLAKNCVKSKRLDVAAVCMGRMKNGRIAKALREASKEPELEARVAILAIHVGMLEEAEELLKSCGRYDLLNKFFQATSEWPKAIEVAKTHDRVHLRNTHHLYAKFLEANGNINEALEHYEKADTHRMYAPRLLLDDPNKLKTYIDQSGDLTLYKWIAQYMESQGDMDTALHYYTSAKDHLSIVRVLCFLNNFQQANEVVQNSGDRAAAYHLARKLEAMDRIEEALTFFVRAQTYGNAIRICKEYGLVDKIWSVALPASPRDQADAARYLEEQGDIDKAILLYQKAGLIHKALNLAFNSGGTVALARMASDLTADTDPVLLQKVTDFFISNYQYHRAVDILATAGKFSEAIALCMEHSVPLTEDLVNRLNPTGPDKNKLLIEIGECALAQNNYHLATKKFTQAGDKVRAMKALLKSGDTEKIIFLAGVSREKEVYVMAANYLQALDWRSNPQLLNTIIQFYTKAKAYSALSNFYVACANVEVEEYRDYDKAVVALTEAKRCLLKASEDLSTRKAMEAIDSKIAVVHHYLRARKSFESNSYEEGMKQCRELLTQLDKNPTVVRVGDVYALMLANEEDLSRVREMFETMKMHVSDPENYLPSSMLEVLGYQKPSLVDETRFDDDLGFEVK